MSRLHVRKRPTLHPAQLVIHRDTRRFRIVRAGRRFGKTRLGVWECLEVALQGGRAWWVAPSYKLGRPGWRDLRRLASLIPGVIINRGERTIELPNGGEVAVRTAANPDDLRADGLDFVVLDEAAFMDPAAWYEALRSALADKLGRALFITTPKGLTNWVAQLWADAEKDPDTWGLHWYGTADNPYIHRSELEALRKELGDLLYRQEVLAEFVELEGTIIRPHWFRYYARSQKWDETLKSMRDVYVMDDGRVIPQEECWRYVVADVALSEKQLADYTVFAVVAAYVPSSRTIREHDQALAAWAKGEGDGVPPPPAPRQQLLLLDLVREHMQAPDVIRIGEQLRRKHQARWVGYESVAYQASLVQFATRLGQKARPLYPKGDKVTRAHGLAAVLEDGGLAFPADETPWLDAMEQELLLFPNADHDDQVDALGYATQDQGVTSTWTAH